MTGRDQASTWPPEWARELTAGEGDVDDVSLHLAIEAGAWPEPALPRAERRAFALIVLASLDARGEGATRLALSAVDARLERLGAAADDRAVVAGLLPRLVADSPLPPLAPFVGRPGDYRPLIVDGDFLYQERDLRLEQRLADALAARLAAPPLPAPAAAATTPEETGRWPWSPQQRAAMDAAARSRLVVISGGPGTGKTALIGGIVRTWEALGIASERIAIAAPTGKAANRIAELMQAAGPVPTTLHRLLGFTAGHSLSGGDFRHHENRPLPQDAIIVDEASMVGLPLMEQLVRALAPDARLVLLGDADQLPAVELGSVFRDLGAHAVRLTTSHRMDPGDPAGASVLNAARAIAAGDVGALLDPGRQPSAAGGFACLSPEATGPHAGRRLVQVFVDQWYQARIKPGLDAAARTFRLADVGDGLDPRDASDAAAALERQRQARLLTVTRTGFAGSDRINAELGRRAAAELGVGAGAPHELAAGTPVMITRNDYDRGLFNGDQGVVLSVAAAGRAPSLAAVFARDGVLVPFPLPALASVLSVAYASTVHKAQGSELEHAALLLPDADLPLLSRELVYTAVTRVRRSITVVGQRALLAQAVARPLERASGLAIGSRRAGRASKVNSQRPMLFNLLVIISAVLGVTIILLSLRAVRRGWSRDSERIRRRLEAGRVLRRAERIAARATAQVSGNTTSADLLVALVLTESELHVFRHIDGDVTRPANGAPFHVLLTPDARDRRELALADAPLRDAATVELRLGNPAPVSWRLTFASETDAAEWWALIDRIVHGRPPAPPEIRAR